jgi:hypothetical protein
MRAQSWTRSLTSFFRALMGVFGAVPESILVAMAASSQKHMLRSWRPSWMRSRLKRGAARGARRWGISEQSTKPAIASAAVRTASRSDGWPQTVAPRASTTMLASCTQTLLTSEPSQDWGAPGDWYVRIPWSRTE